MQCIAIDWSMKSGLMCMSHAIRSNCIQFQVYASDETLIEKPEMFMYLDLHMWNRFRLASYSFFSPPQQIDEKCQYERQS